MAYECHDVSATETRSPSPSEVTEDVASSEWASSNESPDNKDSNGEEELVYGSYVGSKPPTILLIRLFDFLIDYNCMNCFFF